MLVKIVWSSLAAGVLVLIGYTKLDTLRNAFADGSGTAPETRLAALESRPTERVSALGRLEPHHGVRHIAGPSTLLLSVVGRLLVEEGDRVKAGDVLATIDTEPVRRAEVARAEAELANARREYDRARDLSTRNMASESEADSWEMRVSVCEAELQKAKAELELARIRAPVGGRVLEIHARQGEVVGPPGVLDLAETERMYAIAEVYETDVKRLRLGQTATISSPALPVDLSGVVEWIGLKVHKQDVTGTDPAARKDARIIEVKVRLDASEPAAGYTNLQVNVVFDA